MRDQNNELEERENEICKRESGDFEGDFKILTINPLTCSQP
jgi:hypothetical protein